jgi:hypothetical protein
MSNNNQYRFWAEALREGRGVETEPGNPRSGFYRYGREAIAIWRHPENGDLLCSRTGKARTPVLPDEIDDLFGYCAANPISYATFCAVEKTGEWPEDAPATTPAPLHLEPHEAIAHETTALKDLFSAWLTAIGRVAQKSDADKCANYVDAFARLEKKAEAARQEAKAPALAESRRIDALWKPVVDAAAAAKRNAKQSLEPYLIAERAKAQFDPRTNQMEPVKAGTQGRATSLRTRQINAIVDWPALFQYFAGLNERDPNLEAVCQTIVNKTVARGFTPPGVEIRTIEEAA